MRSALLTAAVALLALAPAAHAGTWLAGDLHVHTCYSHDVWCGPGDDNTDTQDFYTYGHTVAEDFQLASLRGLDYLAITDHNDIRSQIDPGFGTDGVIGIHGYENSLHGHGQMLGARRLYDNGDASVAAVNAMVRALHRDGGLLQANHPSDPVWEYGYDVPVDSVEVWNLPRFYQPPLPAASDNDHAVAYWEGWLDRGAHVTATGGSDSHWKATDAQQGVGNPTTWVYARTRDERGILAGVKAGHAFMTFEPPAFAPPRLYLEGGKEKMVGDNRPRGLAAARPRRRRARRGAAAGRQRRQAHRRAGDGDGPVVRLLDGGAEGRDLGLRRALRRRRARGAGGAVRPAHRLTDDLLPQPDRAARDDQRALYREAAPLRPAAGAGRAPRRSGRPRACGSTA